MNKVMLILVVLLLTVFPFFCFAQEAIEKSDEKSDTCEYIPLTQEEYDEQKKRHPEYMEITLEAHNQYGMRSTPGCDKLSFANSYER